MRNRPLHDALREFALESAALLTDEIRDGAELEFDVVDEAHGGGPTLYRYQPRTSAFLDTRWEQLRELPGCKKAADELGAEAAPWLRVNGLRGEQAEPALRAMLDRLYEDATSFGFPEERFERLYEEVETTLFRDAVRARLVAPLAGVSIESDTVELGGGLSLAVGDRVEAPPEATWPEDGHGEPAVLCVLERELPADDHIPAAEAEERFRGLVTALRLWAPGAIGLCAPGWRRSGEGRWAAVAVGGPGTARGESWTLATEEEPELREFLKALGDTPAGGPVGWALGRFEMGCERAHDAEALSDYLLGLRALLDATNDAGEASLALRVAALCAEEGERRPLQRRIEAALSLERFLMGGRGSLQERIGSESPRELVAEMETHLRALLRDVLCGYLEPDLKSVADDILLETAPEPFALEEERDAAVRVEASDLRRETQTTEIEAVEEPVAVAASPRQHQLDGVTESADWGWDDPEAFSAPV
ncbi:MAG TPA: hypothetical protein VFQ12_09665 [Thermoleophilaceae bacterium]|nr:hypothetical protein [Thermoleophilaceae bacterium]